MNESKIIRSDDLRSENRRRVLLSLRRHGASTPAQIRRHTGLSAASISSLTSQMADQHILESTRLSDTEPGTRGRPTTQITLNPGAGCIIALSLTIDLIKAQRVDYAGQICSSNEQVRDTRQLDESELLDALTQAVREVLPADEPNAVHHIGLCFQGVTEHASGSLVWSPIIKEKNIPIGKILSEEFNLPVTVYNDCRLITDALRDTMVEPGANSFAAILFSHGVGLGLYLDGKPFSGTRTSALEMGHLRFERDGALCRCGKFGCIEAYAADYGIERLACGQSIHDNPIGRVDTSNLLQLIEAAESGDTAALQAFAIAGAAIGEGLASLFTLLDPMPVALVGRNQRSFALMYEPMQNTLIRELRSDGDLADMFHCFDKSEPLLERGLIINALESVDTQFAGNPALGKTAIPS